MRIIRYARPPPTTSWRVLRMQLAKLNLAKILPQYKRWAIGEILSHEFFVVYMVFQSQTHYGHAYMHTYIHTYKHSLRLIKTPLAPATPVQL